MPLSSQFFSLIIFLCYLATAATVWLCRKELAQGLSIFQTKVDADFWIVLVLVVVEFSVPTYLLISHHQAESTLAPTVSAPNGIAIGGGTVNNPTVNNYGSILPAPYIKILSNHNYPPGIILKHPHADVEVSPEGVFYEPAFLVVCDRPCTLTAVLLSTGVSMPVPYHFDNPNVIGVKFSAPAKLEAGADVLIHVESKDNSDVHILNVKVWPQQR